MSFTIKVCFDGDLGFKSNEKAAQPLEEVFITVHGLSVT